MEHLIIKNFGPIRDLDIKLKPLSVVIGKQSSGKSTIAKIFATFSWLEKALIRGQITKKGISRKGYLRARCKYHKIEDFFEKDTFIEYRNEYYNFIQQDDKLSISLVKSSNERISIPKITYFPAERGILSALYPIKDSSLTDSLSDLKFEFEKAKDTFFSGFELPWGDTFEYNRQNKISYIRPRGISHQIRLSASSSGTQCALPLLLTIRNLEKTVYENSDKDVSLNFDEIRNDILKIYQNKNYSDETRNAIIQSLLSKYKNSYLLNIVEEPEQNLFPSAQKDIFFDLLQMTSFKKGGKLFITTHSPYILTLLNCVIKKSILLKKYKDPTIANELNRLLDTPILTQDEVSAYMLDNGTAISIINEESALISADLMDSVSDEISQIFEDLLDFELSHDNIQ